ncbi:hypothetical protein KNT64_gp221 [Pseudomonas phage PspYZU05]|uniref:Uncharacterized protein n=1 Tax=Pseudomonas phage PspYZU05 TaxID=1983556 RepID=A0A2U7N8F9_9CAUD|nr:hypothetical protein KNT64_gp221 [Pseudomonas phage PspYZU05]ASD52173.1 hypothetical protein PspYZU05_221 [Pseudomonas phage PspYZU05]
MNPLIKFGAPIVLAASVIYAGLGTEQKKIVRCEAKVTQYITAYFSEEYICTSIDADGKPYIDTCDNFWSKPASDVTLSVTINGVGKGEIFKDGYYYDRPPKITKHWEYSDHFDRYSHTKNVEISSFYNDGDYLRSSDYLGCLMNLNRPVMIRTLFGVKLWEI